jgi:aryl-alcohol dehydrogenase-like predicted oxidoreductase
MQRVRLSGTDLEVSRACFGTMTFGGQTGAEAAAEMIAVCLDAGINFFDTANVYHRGASEEMLGAILRGRRQSVVLASKVRGKMGDGADQQGLSRAAILRAIDESLQRLQTDHLDLYYLHQPDYEVPLEETLAAMEELVRLGKVRYPAVSNYAAWQVVRMHWIAERLGHRRATVSQPMYNLLARGIEQEYLPMCRGLGVATVVYNPLAGGLLTGKHRVEAPLAGSRFDGNKLYLDRYWNERVFAAVEELKAAAAKAGRTMVSLALNWILHHTPADCVILGASRVEQLRENLAALGEGPLDGGLRAACDAAWERLRGTAPRYNR